MGIQVQLRGGTSQEHENFVGANREITIDTTNHTVRVHDGETKGGHILTTEKMVNEKIDKALEDYTPSSDDKDMSKYVYKGNNEGLLLKLIDVYKGMLTESNNDVDFIRTTKSGLLPYSSNSNSSLGTAVWRFVQGYFNNLNTNTLTVNTSINIPGNEVRFNTGEEKLAYDESNEEYILTKDGKKSSSRLCLGCIEIDGSRIYIGGGFPSDARMNDILIKIR